MEPKRDDWELVLGELKSQRLQFTISLEMVEANIKVAEAKLAALPKKKAGPKENPYNTSTG